MATFSEVLTLCSLAKKEVIVGISRGSKAQEVLLTTSKSIALYDVDQQRLLNSWTAKSNGNFTCSAVFDSVSQQCMVIQDAKKLIKWSLEELDIDKASKVTLNFPVHSIISESNHKPYLVFTSGKIESLQSSVVQSKEDGTNGFLAEEESIKDIAVFSDKEDLKVALLTQNMKMDVWNFFIVSLSNPKLKHSSWQIKYDDRNLKNFCILKLDNTVGLMTKWSDSSVHLQIFKPNLTNSLDVNNQTMDITKCIKSKIATTALQNNHVVINETTVNNATNKKEVICSIWDVKYAVQKAAITLPTTSIQKVWELQNCLFFVASDKLLMLPYKITSSSLCSVVGSQNEQESKCNVWLSNWESVECSEAKHSTKTMCTFSKELQLTVEKLLQEGQTDSVICKSIISEILKNRNLDELLLAFNYFTDIPESILVASLQHLFSEDGFILNNNFQESESEKKLNLINNILNRPFNVVFLQKHLKQLPFSDAKLFFIYLDTCLKSSKSSQGSSLSTEKIVDWMCAVLDAHFHNLILMNDEDIVTFLVELNSTVKVHLQFLEELEMIESLMNQIKAKKTLPTNDNNVLYSVEELHIP